MSKKFLTLLLIFCIFTGFQGSTYAETVLKPYQVLILYQERSFFADRRDTVSAIEELMGNFNVEITEKKIEALGNTDLQTYDAVFVIALDQKIDNAHLVNQLIPYKGRIIWLGNSIDYLIKEMDIPLKYKGENYQFITVSYSPNFKSSPYEFSIGQKRLFYEVESLSNENRIYSWLRDGIHQAPFIIESGNLTYISRVDMNEPLFYIFAQYLMNIFPQKNLPTDLLMVSLQDVHGFSDQIKLRNLANRLYELEIPFNFQLIPYFKMKGSEKMYSYNEIPQFVDTLKYLASKGGSLIVEAYPVELGDNALTSLDYQSVVGDTPSPTKDYFESVFQMLVHDGLNPIGFSSPHGELSNEELLYLRAHIMNYVGLRYISSEQYVIYPYILEETKGFHRFYPLNLGYIDYNNPNVWTDFDESLNKISIVEAPFYGVYFSPDLPVSFIDALYDKALQHQLQFFDFKNEPSWVNFESVQFDSSKDQAYLEKTPEENASFFQNISFLFANGVLVILSFGFILFIGIYWRSLRQTKKLSGRR